MQRTIRPFQLVILTMDTRAVGLLQRGRARYVSLSVWDMDTLRAERGEAGAASRLGVIQARHGLAGCGDTVLPSQLLSPRPATSAPGPRRLLLAREASKTRSCCTPPPGLCSTTAFVYHGTA